MRSSGILHIELWQFLADVSGQPIGPIFKDQEFISWLLKLGPICCPETSVRNYNYTLRNVSEERVSDKLLFCAVLFSSPSLPWSPCLQIKSLALCGGGRQAIYHPMETSFTCQVTCFLFKISCPGIKAILQKKGSKVTVFPPQWDFKKETEKWMFLVQGILFGEKLWFLVFVQYNLWILRQDSKPNNSTGNKIYS